MIDNAVDQLFTEDALKVTPYMEEFSNELREAVRTVWQDFESGLLLTNIIGQTGTPNNVFTIRTTPGSLVPTKQFRGLNLAVPANFDHLTPFTQHLIDAIDLGLMLSMLKWCSQYSISTVSKTMFVQAPVWAPAPSPLIHIHNSTLRANTVKLSDGNSGVDVGSVLYDKAQKFIMDRNLFPSKTQYLLDYVQAAADSFGLAVDKWREDSTFSGGKVVAIYPAQPCTIAVFVAFDIS